MTLLSAKALEILQAKVATGKTSFCDLDIMIPLDLSYSSTDRVISELEVLGYIVVNHQYVSVSFRLA